MHRDEILAWVKAERLSLADFLAGLDAHEWQVDSLCSGWTVHDVAAHMTLSTRTTLLVTIKGRDPGPRRHQPHVRRPGTGTGGQVRPGRTHRAAPRDRRLGPPHARRRPLDPLVDALVHGQDIARPLGRTRDMPVEPTVAALGHVRTSRFYGARERFRDIRLIATDCDWSAGNGPHEVRGPVGDLLLVGTGRAAGLAALNGAGVDRVAAML